MKKGFIDLSKDLEKEKRKKLFWQIPLVIVLIIVLISAVSNIMTGHYNPFVSSGDGSSLPNEPTPMPTPIPAPQTAALEDYFDKAVPIVEEHTNTMDTVREAIGAIPQPSKSPPKLKRLTVEEVAAALKAQGALDGAVYKMEQALQRMESEIVNFRILTPSIEAEAYHDLMMKSFLKDQVALKDWLYYYKAIKERRPTDSEFLESGNRHYQEAQEYRSQAEQEREALMQK